MAPGELRGLRVPFADGAFAPPGGYPGAAGATPAVSSAAGRTGIAGRAGVADGPGVPGAGPGWGSGPAPVVGCVGGCPRNDEAPAGRALGGAARSAGPTAACVARRPRIRRAATAGQSRSVGAAALVIAVLARHSANRPSGDAIHAWRSRSKRFQRRARKPAAGMRSWGRASYCCTKGTLTKVVLSVGTRTPPGAKWARCRSRPPGPGRGPPCRAGRGGSALSRSSRRGAACR